jgi:hypothetical protein
LADTVSTARIFIDEWHFGDEGWVFAIGAQVQLPWQPFEWEHLPRCLDVWDPVELADVRFALRDAALETPVLAGVVSRIRALECRFPSHARGHAIPGSGTARDVRQARGWTGDVEGSEGVLMAFLIDLLLTDAAM